MLVKSVMIHGPCLVDSQAFWIIRAPEVGEHLFQAVPRQGLERIQGRIVGQSVLCNSVADLGPRLETVHVAVVEDEFTLLRYGAAALLSSAIAGMKFKEEARDRNAGPELRFNT